MCRQPNWKETNIHAACPPCPGLGAVPWQCSLPFGRCDPDNWPRAELGWGLKVTPSPALLTIWEWQVIQFDFILYNIHLLNQSTICCTLHSLFSWIRGLHRESSARAGSETVATPTVYIFINGLMLNVLENKSRMVGYTSLFSCRCFDIIE